MACTYQIEEKIEKLIEIIEFLVDIDNGIPEQHANMIYRMLSELKYGSEEE